MPDEPDADLRSLRINPDVDLLKSFVNPPKRASPGLLPDAGENVGLFNR